MHIIILDGVAVDKSASAPVFGERGLIIDGDVALSWANSATQVVQVAEEDIPADFVGGKYLYQASELVLNPAWVDPVDAIPAIPAAPEPTERYVSGVEFLRRFTVAQRIAARQLAKTDPIAEDFFDLLDKTIAQNGRVNLIDPDTVSGVGYLAAALPEQRIDPAVILA